jgi:recombination protein RecT
MPPSQKNPQAAEVPKNEAQARQLLDDILKGAYASEQSKLIAYALGKDDRVALFEEVLPPQMKGQARRLINRAVMYFNSKPDLRDCPPADFCRVVLQAAEMGLPLDGKLCYCIKYKNEWAAVPDYKGLVAVAKRSGQIKDIYADCVCEGDEFDYSREGAEEKFLHRRQWGNRDKVIAAYSVVKLPGGDHHVEVMDITELNAIQARATSKKGPWSTDVNEMRKKTVIKRNMKLYCDDPAVARALELDDALSIDDAESESAQSRGSAQLATASASRAESLRARMQTQTSPEMPPWATEKPKDPPPKQEGKESKNEPLQPQGEEEGPPLPWYEDWRSQIGEAADLAAVDGIFDGLEGLQGEETEAWKRDYAETLVMCAESRLAKTLAPDVNGYVARVVARCATLLNDEQVARLKKAGEDRAAEAAKKNPPPAGRAGKSTQKGLPGTDAQAY